VKLLTRENVVCFDGLPFDSQAAQERVMMEQIRQGAGFYWGARIGPDAHMPAEQAHRTFDRLTGIQAQNRSRDDRLPVRIVETLERWLAESGADEIVQWSHTLLAHAAGPAAPNRTAIAAAAPTADKITHCINAFVRVAEAVTNSILNHSGRGMLVPMPQLNPFEKLDNPCWSVGDRKALDDHWDRHANERNLYLEGIEEALRPNA
jgi:hypothetical protein